jgi:hypothetical protein
MYAKIIILAIICSLITSNAKIIPGRIPILMASGQEYDYRRLQDNRWTCSFESSFCNFNNQYNMAYFRRHFDPSRPLFGERSALYLNVSTAGNYQAARLESDYFATDAKLDACLSIKYLMYGTGPLKMYVIQQDIANKCIWVDANEQIDTIGQWKQIKLTVDLRDGEPRFYIEAHFNPRPPHYGTIAISQISFSYGACDYNYANQCFLDEGPPIPQRPPTPVK